MVKSDKRTKRDTLKSSASASSKPKNLKLDNPRHREDFNRLLSDSVLTKNK